MALRRRSINLSAKLSVHIRMSAASFRAASRNTQMPLRLVCINLDHRFMVTTNLIMENYCLIT